MDERRFVIAHDLSVPDTPWLVFDRQDAKAAAAGWAAADKARRKLEEGANGVADEAKRGAA